MRVLITGVASSLAGALATRLLEEGHEVVGIDVRPWPTAPAGLEMHRVDIRKRAAEDVFRRRRPEAVIHMATVSALMLGDEERHRINLGGTRAVFDRCRDWGVRQAVFVGRHTYYGAGPDLPLYHTEDEPPQELATYPELSDLVAADLYAATALWRLPGLTTSVLRVCYTLGPSGHGTLSALLRSPRVPIPLGFDPLFQFMHEDDVVAAIQATLRCGLRGIYNVAGPPPLPLSVIVRATGRTRVTLPARLIPYVLGRAGMPRLPAGALAHLKYPIVIDARAFVRDTGFEHRYDEIETMRQFREAFPAWTAGRAVRHA